MKKVITVLAIAVLCALIAGAAVAASDSKQPACELLRIHIRANSNSQEDQGIKYAIKDAVVLALTPIISNAESKEHAQKLLKERLALIESTANTVLRENGFCYSASAKIQNEYFPARCYEDLVVDSGYYDALIISLGEAEGDNWWCVVYPPLCFLGAEGEGGIQYKSKIKEWIEQLQKK